MPFRTALDWGYDSGILNIRECAGHHACRRVRAAWECLFACRAHAGEHVTRQHPHAQHRHDSRAPAHRRLRRIDHRGDELAVAQSRHRQRAMHPRSVQPARRHRHLDAPSANRPKRPCERAVPLRAQIPRPQSQLPRFHTRDGARVAHGRGRERLCARHAIACADCRCSRSP